MNTDLENRLVVLYGEPESRAAAEKLDEILNRYRGLIPPGRMGLDQRDSILITYPDQVQRSGEAPLQTLGRFCNHYLSGVLSGIHLLPFYPFSSDDGFSVIDYRQVAPGLGSWEDIRSFGQTFRLMFDAVINHISAGSDWFQAYLRGKPPYRDYFIQIDPGTDLTAVARPRTLPLLTPFATRSGEKLVWTTFSADQIDLNYGKPAVLLEIVDLLLFYARQGADFLRLDAIAYLWKEVGTDCIHLPQTHQVIQLFRAVLDELAPHVQLITETNVPHLDNVAYFGDGQNEAQLVYNFALPPLVLHTLHTGDARALTSWASELRLPSNRTTFFNFLASHDGVGVNPVRGILNQAEIEQLVQRIVQRGGLISYKINPDGSHSPYELNINYFDALLDLGSNPRAELQVMRFVAAHAIMFSIVGVPGIYFHSLFGSRGWPEGVRQSGHNRTINRQKLALDELEGQLGEISSLRSLVFERLSKLLAVRTSQAAFHPYSDQRVLEFGGAVFALLRTSPDGLERVLYLQNVSRWDQHMELDLASLGGTSALDLFSGERLSQGRQIIHLRPYQFYWILLNG